MGSLPIWMSVKEVFKAFIHTPAFTVYKKGNYIHEIFIIFYLYLTHLTHLFGKLEMAKKTNSEFRNSSRCYRWRVKI